ncbi:hypothetical protein OQA88_308 [Cercophora sp. LCS_1]
MSNGSERSTQPIGQGFGGTSSWPTSTTTIWGNGTIGPFGKPREAVGSKGARANGQTPFTQQGLTDPADSNDAFPSMPSGSSALAATSEAEPWVGRPGPWNNPDTTQNRAVSGNTSPNRSRIEAPIHDLNNNSSYYTASQAQMQPAIGQRAPARPKTGTAPDAGTLSFGLGSSNLGSFGNEYMNEGDDTGSFGVLKFNSEMGLNGYGAPKRPSQDVSYQTMAGGSARDLALPTSSHSETDLHQQAGSFSDFASFGVQSHSQRPSVSSFTQHRSQYNGLGQQLDRDDLRAGFSNMSLHDVPANSSNGLNGLASYSNGTGPTQFNPLSQPWGPPNQGFTPDGFPSSISYEKRGSVAERSSPANSTYRAGLSSPKSYTGTPHQPSNPWPRPTSRDPRNDPELDRRLQSQQFMPPQSQAYFPYFNNPYQQYPVTGPYDAYQGAYRGPVPVGPGYMPMGPFVPVAPQTLRQANADPSRALRSQLLDEFRSTSKSNKRYELKHIYNHIVEFSGDQHGSRFIQEKLETANSDEKEQVFLEIKPNALQLMRDVFGNYVIQKFFEHGNQVQKKALAGVMKGKVIELSLQMYACRVVQKALEHVLVEQQAELVQELEVDILRVVKDNNGNHVVQKIIELVPRQHIDFIMACLRGRVSELSSHTYGCRVIQRVLEHGSEEDKATIMAEIHQCANVLITDQYGNYVTQHVIAHGKPEDRSKMIGIVTRDLLPFSKHKFASNVVEKCIEQGTTEELRRIRQGLSVPGDELTGPLPLLVKDQYGNYVIQKLLNQLTSRGEIMQSELEAFIEVLRPVVNALKKAIQPVQRQLKAIDAMINTAPTPSTAPQSPALQGEAASVVSTPPVASVEHTPSSSPPSTNGGLVGDLVGDHAGATVEHVSAKLTNGEGHTNSVRPNA